MNPSVELFAKFGDYLNKRISLQELKVWMIPHLPELLSFPDSATGRLAEVIELSIYEFEDGLKSELAIRRRLKKHWRGQELFKLYPSLPTEEIVGTTATRPGSQIVFQIFDTEPLTVSA